MSRRRIVNRQQIIIRDNCCCRRCGIGIEITTFEIHHIVPVVDGGSDEPENLATLCGPCHKDVSRAGVATPEAFATFLESIPDHWIVVAAKTGAPNPIELARATIQFMKMLKSGLADDEGDLEEFLPYFGKDGDKLRAIEIAGLKALAVE